MAISRIAILFHLIAVVQLVCAQDLIEDSHLFCIATGAGKFDKSGGITIGIDYTVPQCIGNFAISAGAHTTTALFIGGSDHYSTIGFALSAIKDGPESFGYLQVGPALVAQTILGDRKSAGLGVQTKTGGVLKLDGHWIGLELFGGVSKHSWLVGLQIVRFSRR